MVVNKSMLRALIVLELIDSDDEKEDEIGRGRARNWIKNEKNSDITETLCKNGRHRWVLGDD